MRKLINRIFKKSKMVPVVFYDDIKTTPIAIWIAIHESGQLSNLCISGKPTPEQTVKAWHKINNQYLKRFGLDKNVRKLIKLRKKQNIAMANYLATGNRKYEMDADVIGVDLENMKTDDEKVPFSEITTIIEKHFGIPIDENETSIEKYYSRLKQVRTHNEQIRKMNLKRNEKN